MAKKKISRDCLTLGEAIKLLKISDEDIVFLHTYNKNGDVPIQVNKIDGKTLKSKIIAAQPYFGGIEYEYNCYRFILNK